MTTTKGLSPIFTENSKILILGTFPSQTSRETNSYYANNSNRFWKVISEFFGLAIPDTYDRKVLFLKQHNIAVWDLIDTCEIDGSKDSTISNAKYNDLYWLLDKTRHIEVVLLNGKTAFEMYENNFKGLDVPYRLVPSTSPANATFDKQQWFEALDLSTYLYERAVKYYIKLMGPNSLYKTVKTDTGTTYIFEDYGIGRTCVDLGVRRDLLKEALIKEIEKGKI